MSKMVKMFTIKLHDEGQLDLCTSVCLGLFFFFFHKSSLIQDSYQALSNHGNSNAVMVMCRRHLHQARQELFQEVLDVEKLEAVAMVSVMSPLNPATRYPMVDSHLQYVKTKYCEVYRFIINCMWDKYTTINCTFVPEVGAAYGHTYNYK